MQIPGVVASSNSLANKTYTFKASYTADTTYTVPAGVSQIAVFAYASGGNGNQGAAGQIISTSPYVIEAGSGGGGGGGGAAAAMWNVPVTVGQTWTITMDAVGSPGSKITNGTITLACTKGSNGNFGPALGAAGGVASQTNAPNYKLANGGKGGSGGGGSTTVGAGADGSAGEAGTALTDPSWAALGLSAPISSSGNGGGGGGAGALNDGTSTYAGGNGPGTGGNGGKYTNGLGNTSPQSGSATTAPDGSGGGGGAGWYNTGSTYGNGPSGGRVVAPSGNIIYIYER